MLLIVALADLGGFLAIIFGPPLAAMIQVLYANLVVKTAAIPPREGALDRLIERLGQLRYETDPESREFTSILQRSDDLIREAREILDGEQRTQAI